MGHRFSLRASVTLLIALSAVIVLASPVSALTELVACNGTCGYSEEYDEEVGRRGANCFYETGSIHLDKITVRPPLMHGNYPQDTKVEWRFKILRRPPLGSFSRIYTSSWQSAKANDSTPAYAGNGFSRRTWTAPENPLGDYKVWVEERWWHGGSVEGFRRVEYDWYKLKWSGKTRVEEDRCTNTW
jgi:hypothetical protein